MVSAKRVDPDLAWEFAQFDAGAAIIGAVDEVGRGSLAGPVSIGLVLIKAGISTPPAGIRDSKQLTPAARGDLAPLIRQWALAAIVAHASANEIDKHGIIGALRLATHRAIAQVNRQYRIDVLLLDGSHDWLSGPPNMPPVVTKVKGDQTSICLAAASIIAKCERDSLMIDLAPQHPQYGWESNKGYAAPDHLAAIAEHGTTRWHRRSWSLPNQKVPADNALSGSIQKDFAEHLTKTKGVFVP
jgi:ribonuclease HII